MSLTIRTPLDILRDLLPHVRPPIVSLYEADRVTNSWVAIDGEIVVVLNKSTSFRGGDGDYSPAILIPKTFNLLQPLWTYPGLQHLFILLVYWVFPGHFLYREFLDLFFTFQLLYPSCAYEQVI